MTGKPFDEGDAAIEEAYGLLRSWTQGLFRFDEHVHSLKYVVAPDGRLVAPVMVAAMQTPDTALFIPDDEAPVLELLLSLEGFEEEGDMGALADRWRIHHGIEEDINWAVMDIDMVRISGLVLDGDTIVRLNPFVDVEADLCRTINGLGEATLQRICKGHLDVDVEHPRAVAIDPLGLDVRARFDVLRLPFGTTLDSPDRALDVVKSWAAT